MILEYVNKRLERNAQLKLTLNQIIFKNTMGAGILLAFLYLLKNIRVILMKPLVWNLIAYVSSTELIDSRLSTL